MRDVDDRENGGFDQTVGSFAINMGDKPYSAGVVLHPRVWTEEERAARVMAVDAQPRLRLLQSFAGAPDSRFSELALGDERVYRLTGPPSPLPSPCAPSDPLPRDGWTLSSSGINKEDRARDGDRRTAWHTALPQRPGDYFEVRFPDDWPLEDQYDWATLAHGPDAFHNLFKVSEAE